MFKKSTIIYQFLIDWLVSGPKSSWSRGDTFVLPPGPAQALHVQGLFEDWPDISWELLTNT